MKRKISLINILRDNQINMLDGFLKAQQGRDLEIYDIHLNEIVKNNRMKLLKMLISNKHRKIVITKFTNYKICDLIVEYGRYDIADLLFSIMTLDTWRVWGSYIRSVTEYVLSRKYYYLYKILRKHNLISITYDYCQGVFDEMDIEQILLLHKDPVVDQSRDSCIGMSFIFNSVVGATSAFREYRDPEGCENIKKEIIPRLKFNFGFVRILHCMIERNPVKSLYDMHVAYIIREFLYGF